MPFYLNENDHVLMSCVPMQVSNLPGGPWERVDPSDHDDWGRLASGCLHYVSENNAAATNSHQLQNWFRENILFYIQTTFHDYLAATCYLNHCSGALGTENDKWTQPLAVEWALRQGLKMPEHIDQEVIERVKTVLSEKSGKQTGHASR